MDRILLSAFLVAIFTVCTACTVKEDRNPCPCSLTVTFSDPDATGSVELLGWDSETVFREQVRIEDCQPEWRKPIRKGVFILSACKGLANGSIPTGHEIRIPVNSQADSLYAFFEEVDATGDYAHANILFHKQFATVFLDILKTEETIRTYRFQVEGNTCARGDKYARQECTLPLRMITAVIPADGSETPLSVKTASPVPKHLIGQVMAVLQETSVKAPVAIGETVVKNVCDTGIDVIATRSI